MKRVYYYNDKLNTIITREEIINLIKTEQVALSWKKHISPVCFIEEIPLKFEVETYTYNLLEIPFHKDWEVIVIDDDSLSEGEINEIIHHMSRGYYSSKSSIISKLNKTLSKLSEFRYKGIKFD